MQYLSKINQNFPDYFFINIIVFFTKVSQTKKTNYCICQQKNK